MSPNAIFSLSHLAKSLPDDYFESKVLIMFETYYRIYFVNGQTLTVAECREEKDYCPELIERFKNALPDNLLVTGNEDDEVLYIPANNILYISIIPEDLL